MYKTYTKTSTFDMDPEWTLRMGCENLKKNAKLADRVEPALEEWDWSIGWWGKNTGKSPGKYHEHDGTW